MAATLPQKTPPERRRLRAVGARQLETWPPFGGARQRPAHNFTVDVEEYFQVSALEPYLPRRRWASMGSRVAPSMTRLLELLAGYSARGTFFILGMVAEKHPSLVRDIAAAGHEVASHGWDHRKIGDQNRAQFRASVRRSKCLLEDLVGMSVQGFRAPSFSIVRGLEWALDVLAEEGYSYDSSLFPVSRSGYGYRGGQRDPHWLDRRSGVLIEVPPTTLQRFGVILPAGGGAYFRLLPYGLIRSGLMDAERRDTVGTFYIHPWELDPDQPRVSVPLWVRMRHYGGLRRTVPRLRRLLSEFRFTTIAENLALMVPCQTDVACCRRDSGGAVEV